MSGKKRGLGKGFSDLGLSELLSQAEVPVVAMSSPLPADVTVGSASDHPMRFVAIEQLSPSPYQPRRQFGEEALSELATSIRAQGLLQPIVVRQQSDQSFEIVAGERRWRACQRAGLTQVPVIVKHLTDQAVLAVALIENLQRENLNAMEEASALHRLLNEFSLTHQQVADAVGKSRAAVTNLIRLLKLNADVRAYVELGRLDMGHARALLSLEGLPQSQLAEQAVLQGWSVRQMEQAVQQSTEQKPIKVKAQSTVDPSVLSLQRNLSDRLSAQVKIQHQSSGKGKLVIKYHNLDELEGILDRIN